MQGAERISHSGPEKATSSQNACRKSANEGSYPRVLEEVVRECVDSANTTYLCRGGIVATSGVTAQACGMMGRVEVLLVEILSLSE